MKSLPQIWQSDRLKDIARINRCALPANTDPGYEFDYLEISNVNYHGIIDPQAIERLRFEDAPSRARRRVFTGNTVISSVRPNLQAVAFIENGGPDFVCSTGFNVVEPFGCKLKPKSSYYVLISESSRQYFEATAKGVGYPAVDDKDFNSTDIPLPPLSEQKRVAAYLDASCAAIDAAVAAKRRQMKVLSAVKKATIVGAVTRGLDRNVQTTEPQIPGYGPTPHHWKRTKLRFIEEKEDVFTEISANIESQIQALLAYRKSIIHECVTGKRRITDADVARAEAHAPEEWRKNSK